MPLGAAFLPRVRAVELWWEALVPFVSGGLFAALLQEAKQWVVGPSCYRLPERQIHHMLEEAANSCCQGNCHTTTTTTDAPWESSFWAGWWWLRVGLLVGMVLSSGAACLAYVCFRAFSGSNRPLAITDAAPRSPSYHVESSIAAAKTALAQEQLRLVREKLSGPVRE